MHIKQCQTCSSKCLCINVGSQLCLNKKRHLNIGATYQWIGIALQYCCFALFLFIFCHFGYFFSQYVHLMNAQWNKLHEIWFHLTTMSIEKQTIWNRSIDGLFHIFFCCFSIILSLIVVKHSFRNQTDLFTEIDFGWCCCSCFLFSLLFHFVSLHFSRIYGAWPIP